MKEIDKKLFDFLVESEGFRNEVYIDSVGKSTIGIGHLIKKGETFTTLSDDEVVDLLRKDLERPLREIRTLNMNLTTNQAHALISFMFNLGVGNFRMSTLKKRLLRQQYTLVVREFPRWKMGTVNGIKSVQMGLLIRRIIEASVFNGSISTYLEEEILKLKPKYQAQIKKSIKNYFRT